MHRHLAFAKLSRGAVAAFVFSFASMTGPAFADHDIDHVVQNLKGGLGALEQRVWDCENGFEGACPGTTGATGPAGADGAKGDHHTDRGCQYASADYRAALNRVGAVQSMSRRGNCLDNAMAESFFATLEHELLRLHLFETRNEALDAVADYIENFYNHERMHSSLDYQSPIEYESTLSAHAA